MKAIKFLPQPFSKGGTKKIEISELISESKLQYEKSKKKALYLKDWASYGYFGESAEAKSQFHKKF